MVWQDAGCHGQWPMVPRAVSLFSMTLFKLAIAAIFPEEAFGARLVAPSAEASRSQFEPAWSCSFAVSHLLCAPLLVESIRAFGPARSTVKDKPLSDQEVEKYNDFFKASCYLALGMIYLKENPLLREPLSKEHLKARLLGHFGSTPGQSFVYMHFNRLIKKYDLDAYFVSGPGHGAPAVLAQSFLEGTYSEVYPEKSQDIEGLQKFFKYFSFPGGTGSHATPEVPGSILEGGELGYSISRAFGSVYDHPNLIAVTMVGDGESETGPLATSWHSNKFLNPIVDGAVLPILHLNGYKINNPTILARISHKELEQLFIGYGWQPYFVEGDELNSMHQAMAGTLEHCVKEIRGYQKQARDSGKAFRPRWPMIVLRSPKGWTGPRKVDDNYLAGFWRAHQVPITDPATNAEHLKILETWMRSYEPDRLFDKSGKPIAALTEMCPTGNRRMSANPVANGGLIKKPLKLPDFRDYAIKVDRSAVTMAGSMRNMAVFLRDVIAMNPHNFRLFGPDETESNKLGGVYEAGKKVWMGEYFEEDANGGNLAMEGRVMEMLSEHTCEGWLEGYVLSGRHGLLNSYEPFIHVIDSMVNQHCKWIEKCLEVEWRAKVASLNILLTAVVWRQDHNGFTHQDPGFLDVVANKSPEVVRIYLPPDGNCLLSVMDHCFRSVNYVNVVVADKQDHLQYLDMQQAIEHCTKGIGIWPQFSTDAGKEPDLVMASCGDVSTHESLAAIDLLLNHFPELKIRCVNCVDLFKLIHRSDHPHGLTDSEWTSIFTDNTPVIFNFHSYPWMIHRLTYKRPGNRNLHVRGYKEKGNIDTPLELAIRNQTDRFSLAIDAIDRMKVLGNRGSAARQALLNAQIDARSVAFETGMDPPFLTQWTWQRGGLWKQATEKLVSR
ncbi:putative phosphoketolase [Paramyrothecium foliicola]|nr:putative phosphoketolase [Paramyrothecium foliicola]